MKTLKYIIILAFLFSGINLYAQKKMTLQQCRELALQKNEDLKMADRQLEKARAEKDAVSTMRLPKFSATGTGIYLNKDFEEDTSHIIYFDMKDIDESKESELSQWYDNQLKTLTDDGWNVNKEVKDKEMISGGIYNNCILMKESENCTLSIGISFNGEGGSTINVAPRYEIR